MLKRFILVFVVILTSSSGLFAQKKKVIYKESEVPQYTLPNPLSLSGNRPLIHPDDWYGKRRPELITLFEKYVYGKVPGKLDSTTFYPYEYHEKALGGRTLRKQVKIRLFKDKRSLQLDMLIYLPKDVKGPVPIFLALNFSGNHTIHKDPNITFSNGWMRNSKKMGITNNKSRKSLRGYNSSRWPVEDIVKRGYGIATIYYGDIDPDFDDGFKNGAHALFSVGDSKQHKEDDWGAISAWAWGLSRAVDYLERDSLIDHKRIAVLGHSRLGKTALWAGARDERIAMVISNNSGCGGAALSKRRFGETVKAINTNFPHWFCGNFKQFNDREEDLPLDQHMLISLIAPRPVYIASAEQDRWADPDGEFLAAVYADPVYRLLGTDGLAVRKSPPLDYSVQSRIGYHLRSGKHDLTLFDWEQYMNFADIYLK